MYDKLVAKLTNTHTSRFVLKTKYDTDKSKLEIKIPDTSVLVRKLDYNAKIGEIESKIPSIIGLVTFSALTAVVNNQQLVVQPNKNKQNKTDFNTKISETEAKITDHNHHKYITTPDIYRRSF